MNEIFEIEAGSENLLIIGDANRHIGSIVPGNNENVSYAGRLLNNFLEGDKYTLVNAMNKTVGGPFTFYDRSDSDNNEKKLLLDIVIVSSILTQYIDKFEIHSKLEWTPCRSDKGNIKYTDPYSLLLTIKNIPMRKSSYPTVTKI